MKKSILNTKEQTKCLIAVEEPIQLNSVVSNVNIHIDFVKLQIVHTRLLNHLQMENKLCVAFNWNVN